MEAIVQNMERAAQQLEQIAHATVEQSRSSQDTNESLSVIRGVALETSSHMENFTATLVKLTGSLEDLGAVAIALKMENIYKAPPVMWFNGRILFQREFL